MTRTKNMVMSSYWVILTMNQKKKTSNFLNTYNLKNIVKQGACFKNPDTPTCIDLILKNSSGSFQDTCTVDFHKLVVTVLKLHIPPKKPNIQTFRDYKRFQNDLFRSELGYQLGHVGPKRTILVPLTSVL